MKINYIDNIDCMEGLAAIPDGSVDLVLCDLPYGTTRNEWDKPLPLDQLWEQYDRVVKPSGVVVLFADGLFMADLMNSNRKNWRYNLIWDKVLTSGFLNANKMPLRQHEELCVFYRKLPTYNPQKTPGAKSHSKGTAKTFQNNNYGDFNFVDNSELHGGMKYPTSILHYQKPHPSKSLHPTQKPEELCEYVIKTYTNPGEVVLDNCMGSGTTAVACIRTGRNYIGFELDERYHAIAQRRIKEEIDRVLTEDAI